MMDYVRLVSRSLFRCKTKLWYQYWYFWCSFLDPFFMSTAYLEAFLPTLGCSPELFEIVSAGFRLESLLYFGEKTARCLNLLSQHSSDSCSVLNRFVLLDVIYCRRLRLQWCLLRPSYVWIGSRKMEVSPLKHL